MTVDPDAREEIEEEPEETKVSRRPRGRGTASRLRDYKSVYGRTRNHRAAIRAYCSGNRWLEANARAVGNW